MNAFWTVGVALSLASTTVLLIAVLGLARELGVLLERMGPTHAALLHQGPEIGAAIEAFQLTDLSGNYHWIAPSKSGMSLLVYTSATCPSCEALMPSLETFSKAYRGTINLVVLSRSSPNDTDRAWHRRLSRLGALVASAPDIHERLNVHSTPYAMLLTSDNIVASAGAVNSLEQIESLVRIDRFVAGHAAAGSSPSTSVGDPSEAVLDGRAT